ncbi:MAG: DUF748 domain-containing protein [Candidatus Omnitrophota bacterium]
MIRSRMVRFTLATVVFLTVLLVLVLLYLKIYGKNVLEKVLSSMLGTKVEFTGLTINPDRYALKFKGVKLPEKIDFKDRSIFSAKNFTVFLDKRELKEKRKIAIDEILIEEGVFTVERNRAGVLNISGLPGKKRSIQTGVAYANEPEPTGLYSFASSIRKLIIKDSVIEFKDHFIYDVPFIVTCEDFSADITSMRKPLKKTGYIPIFCELSCTIPSDRYGKGEIAIDTDLSVYKYMYDADMTVTLRRVDLMRFFPYIEKYTPFSISDGLASSDTKFELRNNRINSITNVVFHRLRLVSEPGSRDGQFLQTSVSRLLPYLTSRQGEILFDFVIRGPANQPEVSLGPQVRSAMSSAVMGEVGSALQGLQGLQ